MLIESIENIIESLFPVLGLLCLFSLSLPFSFSLSPCLSLCVCVSPSDTELFKMGVFPIENGNFSKPYSNSELVKIVQLFS